MNCVFFISIVIYFLTCHLIVDYLIFQLQGRSKMEYKILARGEGGGFLAQMFNRKTQLEPSTKLS